MKVTAIMNRLRWHLDLWKLMALGTAANRLVEYYMCRARGYWTPIGFRQAALWRAVFNYFYDR
jgi:hypothetical protein